MAGYTEKARGLAVDGRQTLVTHKGASVVLGTFWMLVEITSSRNEEFLVSCGLWLLTDDLPLSVSLILQPLCHNLGHSRNLLDHNPITLGVKFAE